MRRSASCGAASLLPRPHPGWRSWALAACLLPFPGLAQIPFDSTAFHPWEVSAEFGASILGLQLQPNGNYAHPVTYSPNTPGGFQVGLRREGLGGSFGYACGKFKDNIDVTTHAVDFQLFLHGPRLATDLVVQDYRGFFVEADASHPAAPFPDLRVSTQTAAMRMKIRGTTDLRTLSIPEAFPESFAWLQYASVSVSHRHAASTRSLAPLRDADLFEVLSTTSSLDVVVPSLSVGLVLSLRRGRFYVAPGAELGLGYPFDVSGSSLEFRNAMKMNLRLMTGSDSPSGGWGLHVVGDFDEINLASEDHALFASMRGRLFKSWAFQGP